MRSTSSSLGTLFSSRRPGRITAESPDPLRARTITCYRTRGFCRTTLLVVRFHTRQGRALLETDADLEPGEWLRINPATRIFLGRKRVSRFRVVGRETNPHGGAGLFLLEPRTGLDSIIGSAIFRYMPLIALALFIAGTAAVAHLKFFNLYYFWYHPVTNVYSLLISCYILSRFVIAALYKPPPDAAITPSVTAVIACKNEEDSIYRTLESLFASDYPEDRFEVIAVDDGSTDGTYTEMRRAAERYSSLRIVRFSKNRGKRDAMAAGAMGANGEILVYIDSDSFVRPDAIRKLVQGFANPEIGAVCGHAYVANAGTNFLTKMQEVRYYVAFRVAKAAESVFSAVTCCSGCLAAYRRSIVMEVLPEWLNQRFLGTQATFGDDRSLTNFVLRRHRVIYTSEAVCSTVVPDRYMKFLVQQTRWKKSWVRETLIASTFIWRRHPLVALSFYLGALFPLVAPVVVMNAFVLPALASNVAAAGYAYGVLLMSIMYGLFYLGRFRSRMWVYGIAFSLFYMAVLVWQTYYAILTVRRNHWGTR